VSSWPAGWSTRHTEAAGSAANLLTFGVNQSPGTGSVGGGTVTEASGKDTVLFHVLIKEASAGAAGHPAQRRLGLAGFVRPVELGRRGGRLFRRRRSGLYVPAHARECPCVA
jgi:hypothetical protein